MLPRISLVEGNDAKYLLFSTKDFISNELFHHGVWDNNSVLVSRMFYSGAESPLVLDIGANLGAYSIPVAKDIQNTNGSVISFEPQRIIYYQLCANILINRLENCYAINKAVSNNAEKIEIPEFDYNLNGNIGAFSLDRQMRVNHGIEASAKDKTYSVDAITLDSFEIDRSPSLIKIDVEGYELNVLKRGVSFLEKHNFPPILFEAWDFDWFKDEKKELLEFITKIGYDFFEYEKTNYIAQHPKHAVSVHFSRGENSVVHMNRVK